MTCSVFIATSLDGFIARPDGNIDWLEAANQRVPLGEDCGYADQMASVDALVMGRATFEKVLGFPDWPYGNTPVYVLSRTLTTLPGHLPTSVVLCNAGSPAEVVALARSRGHERLYVDGGQTIQGFLAAGLIDTLTLTTIPVLLGQGLRLFGPLTQDVALTHLATLAYPFGFVQSRYAVTRASPTAI